MSDHKFASSVEVLAASDVGRRRHWSDAEKLRVVEESLKGHRQVSATARRNGVSRSLLTIWRRQYRAGALGGERSQAPAFIPLTVATESSAPAGSGPASPILDDRVEIALPNGRRLTVATSVSSRVLSRLLRVVDDR